MKIINLEGLTTGERLAYLEEICQEIYNHLYDDYIWVYAGAYVNNKSTYSATHLSGYQDNLDLKPKQIVYFSESGVVAIINQINDVENTFTVTDNYSIKGDKGDKGEPGGQGEKGEQGETGKNALEYSSIVMLTKIPSIGEPLSISLVNCNRTPAASDKVSIYATYDALNKIYILGLSVKNISSFVVNTTIDGIIDLASILPASEQKQLFEHYLFFDCNTSDNNGFFSYGLYWVDAVPGHASPTPTTIEEILEYLDGVNSKMWYGNGFAETADGVTVDKTATCAIINIRKKTDGTYIADLRQIPGNTLYTMDIKQFVNSVGKYTIYIRYNTAVAIGKNANGLNAMVLYSDKNGVLLDTSESLEYDFDALKAAGSDEFKILESINKVRSMNLK